MNAIAHHTAFEADDTPIDAATDDSLPWADNGEQDPLPLLRLVGAAALTVVVLAAASSLLL